MNLKALLAAVAFSALSFGAQALVLNPTPGNIGSLNPGDIGYLAVNDSNLTQYFFDTPYEGLAQVRLVSTEVGGGKTALYTLVETLGNTTTTLYDEYSMTDLEGDATPFFTFVMQAGAKYVLGIDNTTAIRSNTALSAVPLPGAIWLFGSALLGFFGFSSRRKA